MGQLAVRFQFLAVDYAVHFGAGADENGVGRYGHNAHAYPLAGREAGLGGFLAFMLGEHFRKRAFIQAVLVGSRRRERCGFGGRGALRHGRGIVNGRGFRGNGLDFLLIPDVVL